MIRISCTNCQTILSIDDAFAGGVCRCQHCGTIQTVPSRAKSAAQAAAAASQPPAPSKSLYKNSARSTPGSGLDDLASIVVSSGLTSTRLTRSPKSSRQTKISNPTVLIIGATIIIALLVVIIVMPISRNGGSQPGTDSPKSAANTTSSGIAPPGTNAATFCGSPISGNTIIYLLDCGSATGDMLGDLKDATIKSVGTLGSDRRFQILFWNNGTEGAYPETSPTFASKDNVSAAQKAIDEIAPFGQSDVKAALQIALSQRPDQIELATGKGFDLDNAWLDSVLALRGSSPARIDTFSLGHDPDSAPLKKLAAQTGGTYHEVSQGDLHAFGQ